jgi:aldoxime dehydratase
MESAIASHLKCPRSHARRVGDGYAPPYPAWVSRADTALQKVVMGYFGIQWSEPALRAQALRAFSQMESRFSLADGPVRIERAHFIDAAGYGTFVAIAYWNDPTAFSRWSDGESVKDWWASGERESGALGFFREILSPHVERFETLFSTPDRLEGVGAVMGMRSLGDIQEHGYWGSMRERLPIAQADPLSPSGKLVASPGSTNSRRIRIQGHDNVAIIRSGQEWTETQGVERALYLERMEPTLRAGLEFLRDSGMGIGCYFNRYMRHVDPAGQPIEKSFGLSYWRSLGDLEQWAEHHPTHVAIFGTFMQIVQQLQFQLALRLYHEVSVLSAADQAYEYINCHPKTGMMHGVSAVSATHTLT